MTPKVSVLIPCFNAAAVVRETLECLFAQTWPNLEIVVVDDGSTDGSGEVIRQAAGDRVILIRQENRGQTAALNSALSHATGQFVQYIDADDIIDPEKISVQMARLAQAPGCIASARWGRFYDHPENTRFVEEAVYRDLAPADWLALSRAEGLGMMMPALWLAPMEVVQATGPWNEALTLNNDAEYFTRMVLKSERVLFCPEARVRYRSGVAGSLSGQKSARHFASQVAVLELVEAYALAAEDSDRMRRGLSLSWQHVAHAAWPAHPAVTEDALARARRLHPVTIRPGGGPAFLALSRVLGWRTARRLQAALGR